MFVFERLLQEMLMIIVFLGRLDCHRGNVAERWRSAE